MAASIYTQRQIDAMIAEPKHVPFDAWDHRWDGRESGDEHRIRVKVFPDNKASLTEYVVECCKCAARGEASFTLFGRLLGYPEHSVCRYERQLCRHNNPRWFPPSVIGSNVLHRHVYNERAVTEDWPWDKCAEPLKIVVPKRKLSLQQAIDRLTPEFLKDIKLEVHDPQTMGLFRGGK
jgi:hypothetical protein